MLEIAGFKPFVWVLRRSAVSSNGEHELRDDENDGDFAGGEWLKVELQDAHGAQWRQFEPTVEDTVMHIKNTLHEKYGILPEQQRLSFAGRPLLDMWKVTRHRGSYLRKAMMSDYGIHRESVILLSVCPIIASWSRERLDSSQVKHTVPAQVISCKFDRPDHGKLRKQLLASRHKIREVFQRIDVNGGGDLDGAELADMYYAVTSIQKASTVSRMTKMIHRIEELQEGGTKDGALDFAEFWSAICPPRSPMEEHEEEDEEEEGGDVGSVKLSTEDREKIWTEFPELLHLVSSDLDWKVKLLLPKMPDRAFRLYARVKANSGWSNTARLGGDGGVPEASGHTLVACIHPTPKIYKSPENSRLYAIEANSTLTVKGLNLAPTNDASSNDPERYTNQIFVEAHRTDFSTADATEGGAAQYTRGGRHLPDFRKIKVCRRSCVDSALHSLTPRALPVASFSSHRLFARRLSRTDQKTCKRSKSSPSSCSRMTVLPFPWTRFASTILKWRPRFTGRRRRPMSSSTSSLRLSCRRPASCHRRAKSGCWLKMRPT